MFEESKRPLNSKNAEDEYSFILIDDYLPVSLSNKNDVTLKYSKQTSFKNFESNEAGMWVCLLEKAFGKLLVFIKVF